MDKIIKNLKLSLGLILISYAIFGGLMFYLEALDFYDKEIFEKHISDVWLPASGGYDGNTGESFPTYGTSTVPVFLGLCGLAGAYLLGSIKPLES